MSRRLSGLIGLCALGLMLAASPALAAAGYLGAGLGFYTDGSLRVIQVGAGTPAERAGLMTGDIVLEIDGAPPGTAEQVTARMQSGQAGQTRRLKLQRDGQVLNVSAVLIEKPKAAPATAAPAQAPAKAVPADTKAYCKQMYGKAYMLCGMSDHDCKFLAADKWERCEQTGRWP